MICVPILKALWLNELKTFWLLDCDEYVLCYLGVVRPGLRWLPFLGYSTAAMQRIINFYKFTEIACPEDLRVAVREEAHRLGLRGTVLIAGEGINCGLYGTVDALEQFLDWLRLDLRFADIRPKWSDAKTPPYDGLQVKVKNWIIRFADDEPVEIPAIHHGGRIKPEEFREILRERHKDVVIVDTRNLYETDYGSFEGAEVLELTRFTEFRQKFLERFGNQRDKTFIMYCTGGVRCEKSVAWAERHGFQALQLDGGILGYFEQCGQEGYSGQCFVFDNRWLLDAKLTEVDDPGYGPRRQPKPRLSY